MQKDEALRALYNSWHENNRLLITKGEWKPVDKKILTHPENDHLRGLNILAYLADDVNVVLEKSLLTKLLPVIGKSGWIIPSEGRHITVLDIIPHNSEMPMIKQRALTPKYAEVIGKTVAGFSGLVRVRLDGIFASPDGITIQGFPVGEGLSELRTRLREELSAAGLINLEKKKYIIQTAHVGLVKFVAPPDEEKLLTVVDSLRKFPIGMFDISELVLNFSSRYDKFKTMEVVGRYLLEKR